MDKTTPIGLNWLDTKDRLKRGENLRKDKNPIIKVEEVTQQDFLKKEGNLQEEDDLSTDKALLKKDTKKPHKVGNPHLKKLPFKEINICRLSIFYFVNDINRG